MVLAEQLGSFAGQLTETGIRAVDIAYEGAIADLNIKPLTATVLTALLAPQLASINMVNAPLVCRQRDIRVSETRRAEAGDYQTMMRVTVTTERRQRGVAGTVFAGNKPRLVEVEGIPLEAELGHHVLFVRNYDKPGFIGALGHCPFGRGGQHRDLPSRAHRAGGGRDCAGGGRSAADAAPDRHDPRAAERDPGQGDAVLRFQKCETPAGGSDRGFELRLGRTEQTNTVGGGGSDGETSFCG